MSSFPDAPYQTQEPVKSAHDDHGEHHGSWWPFVVALAVPTFLVGIVVSLPVAVIGFLGIAVSIYGWTREDHIQWPKGPNPLTLHTIGVKDNIHWGIVLFLGTEVIIFASLFAVWFQAKAAAGPAWPTEEITILGHALPKVLINTVILVASGVIMHVGEVALKNGNRKGFVTGFAGAILLGGVFLYGQVAEYLELIHEGMTLNSSLIAGSFYSLTGTHGLHVFGGAVLLLIVMIRGMMGHFDKERHSFVTAASYYWHFVDFVWIIVFFVIYVGPAQGWY